MSIYIRHIDTTSACNICWPLSILMTNAFEDLLINESCVLALSGVGVSLIKLCVNHVCLYVCQEREY